MYGMNIRIENIFSGFSFWKGSEFSTLEPVYDLYGMNAGNRRRFYNGTRQSRITKERVSKFTFKILREI
jgi:hypothetical protein